MPIDFDKKINRTGYFERKYDRNLLEKNYGITNENIIINCSIADLDFSSPKPILDELITRTNKQTYSYSYDAMFVKEVIAKWYKKLHNIDVLSENVRIVHGTVNAMFQVVQAFTKENDNIMLFTPIYWPFGNSIEKNNRNVIAEKLVIKDNKFYIDFDSFEKNLKKHNVKLLMFCSPHNPGERIWTKEELSKIVDICKKHNVIIFTDEVHSDLTYKPFTSLYPFNYSNIILANSPNKTFNLGGLKTSYLIHKSDDLKTKLDLIYEKNSITSPNVYGLFGIIGAYNYEESFQWKLELAVYLQNNFKHLKDNLNSEWFSIMEMDAMYLTYIDFHKLNISYNELFKYLLGEGIIITKAGDFYDNLSTYFRINIGLPISDLKKVIESLNKLKG